MNCAAFDWKAYILEELTPSDREGYERHLASCPECAGEAGELRLTLVALRRLPEMEPPRRISFVADPVLQPSWWQRFWRSGPQLGFASAALLAVALVAGAWILRPPVGPVAVPVASLSESQIEERVQKEVDRRLPVLLSESQKQNQAALARIAGLEKRVEDQRSKDLKDVRESFGYLERQLGTLYRTTSQVGGDD